MPESIDSQYPELTGMFSSVSRINVTTVNPPSHDINSLFEEIGNFAEGDNPIVLIDFSSIENFEPEMMSMRYTPDTYNTIDPSVSNVILQKNITIVYGPVNNTDVDSNVLQAVHWFFETTNTAIPTIFVNDINDEAEIVNKVAQESKRRNNGHPGASEFRLPYREI